MSLLCVFAAALTLSASLEATIHQGTPDSVAMLPWMFQEGTDTAVDTANATIRTLLNGTHCELMDEGRVLAAWEGGLKQPKVKRLYGPKD